MVDEGKRSARARPANDNRPPDGQDVGGEADTFERLDALVLTIARLIGRRITREDYEKVMRAANDNAPPSHEGAGRMQMM